MSGAGTAYLTYERERDFRQSNSLSGCRLEKPLSSDFVLLTTLPKVLVLDVSGE